LLSQLPLPTETEDMAESHKRTLMDIRRHPLSTVCNFSEQQTCAVVLSAECPAFSELKERLPVDRIALAMRFHNRHKRTACTGDFTLHAPHDRCVQQWGFPCGSFLLRWHRHRTGKDAQRVLKAVLPLFCSRLQLERHTFRRDS